MHGEQAAVSTNDTMRSMARPSLPQGLHSEGENFLMLSVQSATSRPYKSSSVARSFRFSPLPQAMQHKDKRPTKSRTLERFSFFIRDEQAIFWHEFLSCKSTTLA